MPSETEPRLLDIEPLIHIKEKIYFGICAIVSVAIYLMLLRIITSGAAVGGLILTYLIMGVILYFVVHGLHVGYVRGNGVRVSRRQFPQLHAMVEEHATRLGMSEAPAVFVLQAGGVLNAFATRFLGRNFVIINSDVLALATEKGERAVSFVVGHELAHIKRKHLTLRALLYPSMLVPFLGAAYSRGCEYTCDRIGNALEPEGGVDGLLVLASGRDLYRQVSSAEFSRQVETERGFFVSFAEVISTHPNLPKRVAALASRRPHAGTVPRLAVPQPVTVGEPAG